eukprot:CFRG3004T1
MEWEFVFPINWQNLEDPCSESQYFVTQSSDVTSRDLKRIRDALKDPLAMVKPEVFDSLYSFLRQFEELKEHEQRELWHTLLDAFSRLTDQVESAIVFEKRNTNEDGIANMDLMRNAIKMHVFLICWASSQGDSCQPTGGVQARKVKGKVPGEMWLPEQARTLRVLQRLISEEIAMFWTSVYPEQEFCGCISKVPSRLLENQIYCKDNDLMNVISDILGTLCTDYSRLLDATTIITSLVPKCVHMAVPATHILNAMYKKDKHVGNNVISEIVREMSRAEPAKLQSDTQGTKNISDFLREMSNTVPEAMFSTISVILPHLDGESSTMRSAILHVISRILALYLVKPAENDSDIVKSTTKARDEFLVIFLERLHDTNAIVRKRCIELWMYLVDMKAIPLSFWTDCVNGMLERCADKSKSVRQVALKGLGCCIENNPYGDKLQLSALTDGLRNVESKLKELNEALEQEQASGVKSDSKKAGDKMDNDEEKEPVLTPTEKEINTHQSILLYFRGAVSFTKQIHSIIPAAVQLLASKDTSDVKEVIDLIQMLWRFEVEAVMSPEPGHADPLRSMLIQIKSQDADIRDKVIETYEKVHLPRTMELDQRSYITLIVKNLIEMSINASLADLACLQDLVKELQKVKKIPHGAIKMMWDVFTLRVPNTTPTHARAALIMINFLVANNTDSLDENLGVLLENAFGERGRQDPFLAKHACLTLMHLRKAKDDAKRLPHTDRIFAAVSKYLIAGCSADMDTQAQLSMDWFSAGQECVNLIYHLSDCPAVVATSVIRSMSKQLELASTRCTVKPDVLETKVEPLIKTEYDADVKPSKMDASMNNTAVLILSRLLSTVGHVAFKQLVLCETIEVTLKRRRQEKKDRAEQLPIANRDQDEDDIADELGVGGADDAEAEKIANIIEFELITGEHSLLALYKQMIVHACRTKHSDPLLGPVAVLAMCKFMCVSQQFCQDQLQVIFTLLEKSKLSAVRTNVMICLGDLAQRHPNLVEPWTGNLYERLRKDKDTSVRKNTLLVLTHLILNDQIKIKGQISHIAVCLEDEDIRIRSLASLFFSELSKKENAIYNILPDIISKLSSREEAIEVDTFRRIMDKLLTYIERDKQSESLIEKLCKRFESTYEERQWQDLTFCLAKLKFTPKGVEKLIQSEKSYCDKMVDGTVYKGFKDIIARVKKTMKPEQKAELEDYELRLDAKHNRDTEEVVDADDSQASQGSTTVDDAMDITPQRPTCSKVKEELATTDDSDGDIDMFDVSKEPDLKPNVVQVLNMDEVDDENDPENDQENNNRNPNIASPVALPRKRPSRLRRGLVHK